MSTFSSIPSYSSFDPTINSTQNMVNTDIYEFKTEVYENGDRYFGQLRNGKREG